MNTVNLFSNSSTAVYRLPTAVYPDKPPFHPSSDYPEYLWQSLGGTNYVYEGVRNLFALLGMDKEHFGDKTWNPLAQIIKPGDKVILKPSLLWQSHKYHPNEWEQVITHGSVVRAVVDYVMLALQGQGQIWITDGPQLDADWAAIIERTGLKSICDFYRQVSSIPVQLLDLRDTWIDVRDEVAQAWHPLPGDPAGGTIVNLGNLSCFVTHHGAGRYHGSDYSEDETNYHHGEGRHEYKISKTVASADVFINLPKMKTHKKVGVTLCLKNLVGINVGRNWLPHHTGGDPSNGGDQFPTPSTRSKIERLGVRSFQKLTLRHPRIFAHLFRIVKKMTTPLFGHTQQTIRSGNWFGNDTAWRMVQDINRCLMYGDGENFPLTHPKRYFAIVDGVVAGDGNGPEAPNRKEAGMLVAGFNPVSVDCTSTKLMGFDPMKLPVLLEAFKPHKLSLASFSYKDINVESNHQEWNGCLSNIDYSSCHRFVPHFGWIGKIELNGF